MPAGRSGARIPPQESKGCADFKVVDLGAQNPASETCGPTRRRIVQSFFAVWGGAAMGLVALLGREGCEGAIARSDQAAELAGHTAGWQVRHWLPADPMLAGMIAGQLAMRGPRPGVREEIFIAGRAGLMGEQLRRAGWTVSRSESGGEPRVEMYSPERRLEWSGRFRAEDFRGEEIVLLDTVVLNKVARGEVVAPFVPVGCVSELPRRPAAARSL